MNEATTPKDSPWDEELLRAVAILQLKCLMLDGQSDILSDLSDMQAHRRLNSTLSGYIVAHARSGALPPNPLGEIKTRIEKLSQVFSDITRLKKVLQDRYRFLFNNPFKSSLADIIQSQKTLEDDISQLPARLGALGAELSPLDWRDSPSTEDLLPELLLCAQGLEIDLPDEASRTEYRSLAQAKGPSYEKLQQLLQMAPGRVHALLEAHSQHREILAQVAELNASGDFVTARQLLNQGGIEENSSCRFNDLDYSPAIDPDQQRSLVNQVREFAEALPDKCQACVQRFSQFAGTARQGAQLQNEKNNLANWQLIFSNWEKTILAHPGSELEQECKPHLKAVNDWFAWAYAELAAKAAAGSKKRTQTITAVIVASVSAVFFLGLGLALWNHSAKAAAEKQARQAEVAAAEAAAEAATESRRHDQEAIARVSQATKETPFVNSLGMKFVPVPGTDTLFSVWDTMVRDFQAYAKAVDYQTPISSVDWEHPGFEQTAYHPVVGVSWEEAKDFCKWLTVKERVEGKITATHEYRLPTDAEWSVAVGRGKYPWGNNWPPPMGAGNYDPSNEVDLYSNTSPCGNFSPNTLGLCDLGGNVWQWCEDWYRASMNEEVLLEKYLSLKNDGGGQKYRVARGGAWNVSYPECMLSSYRDFRGPGERDSRHGFRCVLGPSH